MVMVMVMNDLLPAPLRNANRPSHSEIQLFQNLTMKIHGQGHVCGQRSRSCLTFKIRRSRLWSRSNPLVTFEAWSSIDMFAFHFMAIRPYLTLKIQGQCHGQGQITFEASEFNRYVFFLFHGNRTTFGWDIGNKLHIDLENSRSWPRSNLMVTFEALEFNRYVCFSFRGNWTIFCSDIANSIFDLENSRSSSWPRLNPMVTFEP